MKESIGTKIFKQFYNISGPIDEYKKLRQTLSVIRSPLCFIGLTLPSLSLQ